MAGARCDRYARDALAANSSGACAVGAIRHRCGNGLGPEPRRAGRIVLNDPAERRWLEQLVHPLVRQRFEQELARPAPNQWWC